MLVVKHNRKIENKPKAKKPIKKIVFGIIIGILVVIAVFFAIVSFEALMTPNMTSYKPIIYLYSPGRMGYIPGNPVWHHRLPATPPLSPAPYGSWIPYPS